MKLLIVDDEKLTRNGIRSSINWSDLQITDIYEAENGREGLSLARTQRPEIILTDVRMPQMDGVEMAMKIHTLLPNTVIIFMSGYSDKEYLKAAIRLNAVSYVEKPLNIIEITDAVSEAIERVEHLDLIQRGQTIQTMEKETQLALLMTHVPRDIIGELQNASAPFRAVMPSDCTFTSVILQFIHSILEIEDEKFTPVHQEIDNYLLSFGLHEMHVVKYGQHMCYFLYGPRPDRDTLRKIAFRMQSLYAFVGEAFLAIGETATGILHAYDSYSSAVILLQSSFFCDSNTILSSDETDMTSPAIIRDFSSDFQEVLNSRDASQADAVLAQLVGQFRASCTLLPNQVKDIYYKLFIILQKTAQQAQISSFLTEESQSIWDMIDNAATLTILHDTLVSKTQEYFALLIRRQPGNNMIFTIKEFIHQNYQNESLSVKSISDHVMRSAPYVCTFFKSETGQTLNQYITEYRVEKARSLLEDPRYKITDVAEKVGYLDVNYFGKIFKKTVGLSPSEYRGKMSE